MLHLDCRCSILLFCAVLLSALVVLVEFHNGLDTLAENIESEILVRRMDGIAFEAEAHEHGLNAEYLLEIANDGNAATATHCKRLATEGLFESHLGSLVGRQCDGAHSPRHHAWE